MQDIVSKHVGIIERLRNEARICGNEITEYSLPTDEYHELKAVCKQTATFHDPKYKLSPGKANLILCGVPVYAKKV